MSWELANHLLLDGFHSDATAIPAAKTDKESGKSQYWNGHTISLGEGRKQICIISLLFI